MRTNSSHNALLSARAAAKPMATAPVATAAGFRRDIVSPFYDASDPPIREIDVYVLGLRVHMRLARSGRANPKSVV
jgi:hypothetical protein